MKLKFHGKEVTYSRGLFLGPHTVIDAIEHGGRLFIIYDYMEFPRGRPAPNLYCYDLERNEVWRAEHLGSENLPTDAYVNFMSVDPLVVGNFAGYEATIDIGRGRLLETRFTK